LKTVSEEGRSGVSKRKRETIRQFARGKGREGLLPKKEGKVQKRI